MCFQKFQIALTVSGQFPLYLETYGESTALGQSSHRKLIPSFCVVWFFLFFPVLSKVLVPNATL